MPALSWIAGEGPSFWSASSAVAVRAAASFSSLRLPPPHRVRLLSVQSRVGAPSLPGARCASSPLSSASQRPSGASAASTPSPWRRRPCSFTRQTLLATAGLPRRARRQTGAPTSSPAPSTTFSSSEVPLSVSAASLCASTAVPPSARRGRGTASRLLSPLSQLPPVGASWRARLCCVSPGPLCVSCLSTASSALTASLSAGRRRGAVCVDASTFPASASSSRTVLAVSGQTRVRGISGARLLEGDPAPTQPSVPSPAHFAFLREVHRSFASSLFGASDALGNRAAGGGAALGDGGSAQPEDPLVGLAPRPRIPTLCLGVSVRRDVVGYALIQPRASWFPLKVGFVDPAGGGERLTERAAEIAGVLLALRDQQESLLRQAREETAPAPASRGSPKPRRECFWIVGVEEALRVPQSFREATRAAVLQQLKGAVSAELLKIFSVSNVLHVEPKTARAALARAVRVPLGSRQEVLRWLSEQVPSFPCNLRREEAALTMADAWLVAVHAQRMVEAMRLKERLRTLLAAESRQRFSDWDLSAEPSHASGAALSIPPHLFKLVDSVRAPSGRVEDLRRAVADAPDARTRRELVQVLKSRRESELTQAVERHLDAQYQSARGLFVAPAQAPHGQRAEGGSARNSGGSLFVESVDKAGADSLFSASERGGTELNWSRREPSAQTDTARRSPATTGALFRAWRREPGLDLDGDGEEEKVCAAHGGCAERPDEGMHQRPAARGGHSLEEAAAQVAAANARKRTHSKLPASDHAGNHASRPSPPVAEGGLDALSSEKDAANSGTERGARGVSNRAVLGTSSVNPYLPTRSKAPTVGRRRR
ncbi:hypothetical protein BESB_003550 [Besnoitia besnoiti]|uniref:Uncharacterized protein n=1 Tax=Besnoitia besnoiti TaxID=94643 RepID=A0A2A9ML95_BESBE|nr:hypothetical protein BESB_003550 [Besnoitia besnoiti]PFH38014.1 hypothetical protein BESB_003550 [Besnoitia besnoiti]